MKPRIKGWVTTVDTALAFFEAVTKYQETTGREVTLDERAALMDLIAKKMPQEHLEAYLQGKKVLVIKEPSNGQ
jgi:hypothetical protein